MKANASASGQTGAETPHHHNGTTSAASSSSTNAHHQIASHLSTTTSLLNNGMQMISQSLQKKFSRGVNYNSNYTIID